jgi:hypothetical protein
MVIGGCRQKDDARKNIRSHGNLQSSRIRGADILALVFKYPT